MDPALEAEIEAALGEMSIADIDGPPAKEPTTRGGRPEREGTVVQVRGQDVLVEFGPRTSGVCPLSAFDAPPALGAKLTFTIERRDLDDDLLILSRKGSISKAKWTDIAQGQVIEAMCTGTNKGGLEIDVSGHKAFMPAGQVDLRHIPDLSDFVGKKLACEVMELDRGRDRMVLSRRSVLYAERKEKRDTLMATLQTGQSFDGVVTSVQQYGVFVDIGGVDGLVHVSDMSWDRIKNPSDLVKEGDAVRVQVLKVDLEKDPPRIGLGMKQLVSDPFTAATGDLQEGAIVSGTVTKLAAFGAFVKIAEGIEGLVHISEMAHKRISRPNQVVQEGEVVEVKILKIDPDTKRIGLSIKQTKGDGGGGEGGGSTRPEDPAIRKLRAKFGDGPLKGGIG
ncbi:MAG: S1 RNA-binding domain-containing protein [Phycisphaerales bacterium]|nr:S1 RNA-binding domain-containing protein [Phycisphaerales bacterium]MDP7086198.1 S1 RNA-binding domain-containing protein [Phycisphaerales bacterium]MDP7190030.1 S1 RNA-binding domain-containing protein [Phycisphaerales bacterium]